MDENIPLDSGITADPEDARTAGQWLEGYWRQTIPWAFRAAGLCGGYAAYTIIFGFFSYQPRLENEDAFTALGLFIGAVLVNSPVIAAGYFLYHYARNLQLAFAMTDQDALETAFKQFQRTILTVGLLAFLWILLTLYQTYYYLNYLVLSE